MAKKESEIHDKDNNILINVVNDLKKIINNLKITQNIDETINNINNIIQNLDSIININKEIPNFNSFKTEIYENGDKYIGQTKNGKAEGRGIYTFKNGDKYEG